MSLFDNRGVSPEREVEDTIAEILGQFDTLTGLPKLSSTPYEDAWRGMFDEGVILFVDIPVVDNHHMRKYLELSLPKYKKRFRQIGDIYIAVWDIGILA